MSDVIAVFLMETKEIPQQRQSCSMCSSLFIAALIRALATITKDSFKRPRSGLDHASNDIVTNDGRKPICCSEYLLPPMRKPTVRPEYGLQFHSSRSQMRAVERSVNEHKLRLTQKGKEPRVADVVRVASDRSVMPAHQHRWMAFAKMQRMTRVTLTQLLSVIVNVSTLYSLGKAIFIGPDHRDEKGCNHLNKKHICPLCKTINDGSVAT
uniref:Uncharacterized protein n=1 Tax=Panagrellus redivivus TaxID=6233 RepID=A0A7E4ULU2_PANRE